MKRFLTILMTVLLLCSSVISARIVFAEDEEDNTESFLETQEVSETEKDLENLSEEDGMYEADQSEQGSNTSDESSEEVQSIRSTSGTAYAVLTEDGDFIFFRSYETYEQDSTYTSTTKQDVVDIFDNSYYGYVFTGIEEYEGNSSNFNWGNRNNLIKRVFVAEDQQINLLSMSYMFDHAVNMVSFDSSGLHFVSSDDVNFGANRMDYLFSGCRSLVDVNFDGFDASNVDSYSHMFCDCTSLEAVDLSFLKSDKSSVSYDRVFSGCTSLKNINISGFSGFIDSTSNPIIEDCPKLETLTVGNELHKLRVPGIWQKDTQKTYDFYNRGYLKNKAGTWTKIEDGYGYAVLLDNGDLVFFRSNENYSIPYYYSNYGQKQNVVDIEGNEMYGYVSSWAESDIDTDIIDISQVKRVYSGGSYTILPANLSFKNYTNLVSVDLNGFDTSMLNYLSWTFENCTSLTDLNISNLVANNASEIDYVFKNCSSLTEVDISNLDTGNAEYVWSLFEGCESLKRVKLGTKLTKWDYEELPKGEWTNGNLCKTDQELYQEYPSHASQWAGWWTWRAYSNPLIKIVYHSNFNGDETIEERTPNSEIEVKNGDLFSRKGYSFVRWNTLANGTGFNYGPGSVISNSSQELKTVHLYAQWLRVFDRDIDGFPLQNFYNSFGYPENYKISRDIYVDALGYQYKIMNIPPWGGNCLGLSIYSMRLWKGYDVLPYPFAGKITNEVHDEGCNTKLTDRRLLNLIEKYQLWQLTSEYKDFRRENKIQVSNESQQDLLNLFADLSTASEPYLLNIYYKGSFFSNLIGGSAHTVVFDTSRGVEYLNDGCIRIYTYDSTEPHCESMDISNTLYNRESYLLYMNDHLYCVTRDLGDKSNEELADYWNFQEIQEINCVPVYELKDIFLKRAYKNGGIPLESDVDITDIISKDESSEHFDDFVEIYVNTGSEFEISSITYNNCFSIDSEGDVHSSNNVEYLVLSDSKVINITLPVGQYRINGSSEMDISSFYNGFAMCATNTNGKEIIIDFEKNSIYPQQSTTSNSSIVIGNYDDLSYNKIQINGELEEQDLEIKLNGNIIEVKGSDLDKTFDVYYSSDATGDEEEREMICLNDLDGIDIREKSVELFEENHPEGIHVKGLNSTYIYTGSQIKPEFEIIDSGTLLEPGKDYTVKYSNNIKVGEATITVTGKGNYTKKETVSFNILPKSLEDDDLVITGLDPVKYNGKTQKLKPTIKYNGKTLKSGTDYTLEYNDSPDDREAYKDVGTYSITVKGKGNYSGVRMLEYTIVSATQTLISKVTLTKPKDVMYTGEPISEEVFDVVLKDKNNKDRTGGVLIKGTDYELTLSEDTINVGKVDVKITGLGYYSGTRTTSFKITGIALSKTKVNNLISSLIYDGSEKTQNAAVLTYQKDKNAVAVTLEEGKDYVVSYSNNVNKGTATILFTGKGLYTGTVKKTYKITPYDILTDGDHKVSVDYPDSVVYSKAGAKPKVSVYYGDTELVEGTDYTVSYKNNTAVNDRSNPKKIPSFTIKGKGNFKGSLVNNEFSIAQRSLTDNVSMTAVDKVYSLKKNGWKSAPVLTDSGKKLVSGTDYDKNSIVYTYVSETSINNGTNTRQAGDTVEPTDIIPAGTRIRVTVTGIKNFRDELSCIYRITKADISKASITVQPKEYTGEPVTLTKDDITVKLSKQVVDPSNYEIDESTYRNNVNKGKASVILRGVNDLGSSKTVNYSIGAKLFQWWFNLWQ